MAVPQHPLVAALTRYASGLRFPQLFALTAGLFLLDLLIPDVIPFADEILLGLGAILFGTLRKRTDGAPPPQAARITRNTPAE